MIAFLLLSIPPLLTAWYIPTTWFQDSALCRLPIFLTGILIYTSKNKLQAIVFVLLFFVALCAFCLYTGKISLTYYLAPFVIVFLILIVYVQNSIVFSRRVAEFLGAYTLELYIANCVAMKLVPLATDILVKQVIYYGATIIIAFVLYKMNKLMEMVIGK